MHTNKHQNNPNNRMKDEVKDLIRQKKADNERMKEEALRHEMECQCLEFLASEVERLEDCVADRQAEVDELNATLEKQRAAMEKLQASIDRLKDENTTLKDEAKAQAEQMKTMKQVNNAVAKQSEHDDLIRVVHRYMMTSQKKSVKKRGYIKMVLQELVATAHLVLCDEDQQLLDALDDEVEKPMVNIERVNDIHGNDKVELKP